MLIFRSKRVEESGSNGHSNPLRRCFAGIEDAIAAAFPKTEYQRCILHQVRNTLKYVSDKDRKSFATDLKTIYQVPAEEKHWIRWRKSLKNGRRNIRIP